MELFGPVKDGDDGSPFIIVADVEENPVDIMEVGKEARW